MLLFSKIMYEKGDLFLAKIKNVNVYTKSEQTGTILTDLFRFYYMLYYRNRLKFAFQR